MITLSNDRITVQIAKHGAELQSIIANGREYLWQGDPIFWGRRSPILFPFVGRVWNNVYRHEGVEYSMGQHGFARDMDFSLKEQTSTEALFALKSTAETLAKYPFRFTLQVGYRIDGSRIIITWTVRNDGDSKMHFQIGAHPAFYYRDLDLSSEQRGYLYVGADKMPLQYISPTEKGCTSCKRHSIDLPDGYMELTTKTFACDTYIFDGSQVSRLTLADKQHRPYISLSFHTPLVAVWSPTVAHPDVPFVCLEPWYGRCDRVGYVGELANRDCMEHLAAGSTFIGGYDIEILEKTFYSTCS